MLNDASYLLAEADGDLTFAEKESRKAIAAVETRTATADVGEANAESSYAPTVSWQTGTRSAASPGDKLDEARDYLEAAWRNEPATPMAHTMVSYLRRSANPGKPSTSMRSRAPATVRRLQLSPNSSPYASIDRLSTGVNRSIRQTGHPADSSKRSHVQDQTEFPRRVIHVRHLPPPARRQWNAGSPQCQRRNPIRRCREDSIRKLALPHFVPAHSSARILRDAVLTCSPNQTDCFFVLMPMGTISNEHVGR